MFGSSVLEIGIGLIFTYLLVSLVCTAMNELLAASMRSRALDLERGIRNLLEGTSALAPGQSGGPFDQVRRLFKSRPPVSLDAPAGTDVITAASNAQRARGVATISLRRCSHMAEASNAQRARGVATAGAQGWMDHFFAHSLINALSKDGEKPSYVPSQTFAMVLMDLVARRAADRTRILAEWMKKNDIKPTDTASSPTPQAWLEAGKIAEYFKALSDPDLKIPRAGGDADLQPAGAIQKWLTADSSDGFNADATFDEIRGVVNQIDNQYIKKALLPLIAEAQSDTSKFGTNLKRVNDQIEIWFNHSMERVSGWYKRRTERSLFLIALGATFFLNVDTISICQSLARDGTLRQSVVAAAQRFAERPPTLINTAATQPSAADTAKANNQATDNLKVLSEALQSDVGRINDLGIPVGWKFETPKDHPTAPPSVYLPRPDNFYDVWTNGFFFWITKIFGLLLTAVAASLGAPFWFDVLNRVMSIRSAGKAPEDKPKAPRSIPQPASPEDTPSTQTRKPVSVS